MKTSKKYKPVAVLLLAASTGFFMLGFRYPLLESGFGIGPFTIEKDTVYLWSSFSYFFRKGEHFIGILLLLFTIIFPVIKYIFLGLTLAGFRFPHQHWMGTLLEMISKWAMLDVFVVAVLILNLKFDSTIIISRLGSGTSLFALSVILLMFSSYITRTFVSPLPDAAK